MQEAQAMLGISADECFNYHARGLCVSGRCGRQHSIGRPISNVNAQRLLDRLRPVMRGPTPAAAPAAPPALPR